MNQPVPPPAQPTFTRLLAARYKFIARGFIPRAMRPEPGDPRGG